MPHLVVPQLLVRTDRCIRRRMRARVASLPVAMISTALVLAACAVPSAVRAQGYTLKTLVNFDQPGTGEFPYAGPTLDSNGNLFGTTSQGGPTGSDGTVWEYTPSGTGVGTGGLSSGTLSTLGQFSGANGSTPYGGATLEPGTGDLYGTTYVGGNAGDGTVWQYNPTTMTLTTLVNLNGSIGGSPYAGVTLDGSGGALYGTSEDTLWQYNPAGTGVGTGGESTGTFTGLADMNNGPAPVEPLGLVSLDGAGNLYGTSQGGGIAGYGTAWEYTPSTSTLAALGSFDISNGSIPFNSSATLYGGNLYGTTGEGGAFDNGTLWEVDPTTHSVTDLVSFNDLDTASSAFPYAGVISDGHGDLFGTAEAGGLYNEGTVWEYDLNTSTYTTLESFNFSDGGNLYGAVAMDPQGDLFGATYSGGAFGDGTVFELQASAPEPGSLPLLLGLVGCTLPLSRCRRRR